MGWSSSPDTRRQVKLRFDSEAEAIEYAKQKGYTYTVVKRNERKVQPKSYADNFAYSRMEPGLISRCNAGFETELPS